MRPVEVINQIAQPIYFIHGREDVVISVDETVGLHRVSNNPEDRLWLVPGAEHINVYERNRAAYVRRVATFFEEHVPWDGKAAECGDGGLSVPVSS